MIRVLYVELINVCDIGKSTIIDIYIKMYIIYLFIKKFVWFDSYKNIGTLIL